jgi:hypothetical protein
MGMSEAAGTVAKEGMSEASASFYGGAISAGGSLVAGIFNYFATKETNRQNRELFDINRKDSLAAQKSSEKLAKANLALNTRQQTFSESEAVANRAEATEQKGYGRIQSAYQRGADIFSKQLQLNQIKAAPFQKYAAGR